jgi:hypothetical protein
MNELPRLFIAPLISLHASPLSRTIASKISPSTLKVSSTGSIIYPKHVHHALHHYLGIDDYARSVGYDFKNTELYDFFNPALNTAGPMPSPFGPSDLY